MDPAYVVLLVGIVLVVCATGVAEGLKKKMESGQKAELQDFSKTAEQYATNVFQSYGDYSTELRTKNDTVMFAMTYGICPKELRSLFKDSEGNYIVLVGEAHSNGDGSNTTQAAEKVLTTFATQKPKEGVQGIAAVELPILDHEKTVQWRRREDSPTYKEQGCAGRFTVPGLHGMVRYQNCTVPEAFTKETETVGGEKTVVGSAAGRRETVVRNDDSPWISGVSTPFTEHETKQGAHLGSINHSVFQSENLLGEHDIKIRGGEPARAFLYGAKTRRRNEWAAKRLTALAKETSDKKTVVVMSYGMAHLCAGFDEDVRDVAHTTQGFLVQQGWTCEEGCDFFQGETAHSKKYDTETNKWVEQQQFVVQQQSVVYQTLVDMGIQKFFAEIAASAHPKDVRKAIDYAFDLSSQFR